MTAKDQHPKRHFLTPEMQLILCSGTDVIATSGNENDGEWDKEIYR